MAGGFGWDEVGPGEKKNAALFEGYRPKIYETSSDRTLISFTTQSSKVTNLMFDPGISDPQTLF